MNFLNKKKALLAVFVSMESIWEQHKQQQKGHEKEVTAVVIRP